MLQNTPAVDVTIDPDGINAIFSFSDVSQVELKIYVAVTYLLCIESVVYILSHDLQSISCEHSETL